MYVYPDGEILEAQGASASTTKGDQVAVLGPYFNTLLSLFDHAGGMLTYFCGERSG